jgi:hypothetical protein
MQLDMSCPVLGPQWGLEQCRWALFGLTVQGCLLRTGGNEVVVIKSVEWALLDACGHLWALNRAEKIWELVWWSSLWQCQFSSQMVVVKVVECMGSPYESALCTLD